VQAPDHRRHSETGVSLLPRRGPVRRYRAGRLDSVPLPPGGGPSGRSDGGAVRDVGGEPAEARRSHVQCIFADSGYTHHDHSDEWADEQSSVTNALAIISEPRGGTLIGPPFFAPSFDNERQ
jgi:hypothetical protein